MNRAGRNDPCLCGSGKKYKSCCLCKRPREQLSLVGHSEKFDGIQWNVNGQAWVHLLSGGWVEAESTFYETSYARKSGKKKTVSHIPNAFVPDVPTFLSSFDAVFAIDTNTKEIRGSPISVSVIARLWARRLSNGDVLVLSSADLDFFCFKGIPGGEAEKYAWRWLVRWIVARPEYKDTVRIALISDHDIRNHQRYNSGQLPIYGDFYLPKTVTILYATTDSGNTGILNKYIRQCDKHAGMILKGLEADGAIIVGETTIVIDQMSNAQ